MMSHYQAPDFSVIPQYHITKP